MNNIRIESGMLLVKMLQDLDNEYGVKLIAMEFNTVLKSDFISYQGFEFIRLPYGEVALCRIDKNDDADSLTEAFGKALCSRLESVGKAIEYCDKHKRIVEEYNELVKDLDCEDTTMNKIESRETLMVRYYIENIDKKSIPTDSIESNSLDYKNFKLIVLPNKEIAFTRMYNGVEVDMYDDDGNTCYYLASSLNSAICFCDEFGKQLSILEKEKNNCPF